MKIDKVDQKLLYELDRNSRQSFAGMAKACRVPPDTLRYRTSRLIESGVIQNFLTVIDGGRLGFYHHQVFLRLFKINPAILAKIVSFLTAERAVVWVVQLEGIYDIAFSLRVTSPKDVSDFIDKLKRRYMERIHHSSYSVNIELTYLHRGYLRPRKLRTLSESQYRVHGEVVELDSVDHSIIASLCENARRSASEIGRAIGFSADAVLLRIKRLERKGIIIRYSVVLDNAALSQANYYVLLRLDTLTADREAAFVSYCSAQPNITYITKSLGEWEYELNIEVSSFPDYQRLIMELTSEFHDIVRDYSSLRVLKIDKFQYPAPGEVVGARKTAALVRKIY